MPLDPEVGDRVGRLLERPEPGQAYRVEKSPQLRGDVRPAGREEHGVGKDQRAVRLDRAAMRRDHRPELGAERVGHRGAARGGSLQPPGDPLAHALLPPLVAADEILELAPLAVRGPRQRRQDVVRQRGLAQRHHARELRRDDRIGRVEPRLAQAPHRGEDRRPLLRAAGRRTPSPPRAPSRPPAARASSAS